MTPALCQVTESQTPAKPVDLVRSPPHYTKGAIQNQDIVDQLVDGYPDSRMAYYVGNVQKYLNRAPFKGNLQQDLEKAEFFLRRAINRAASLSR